MNLINKKVDRICRVYPVDVVNNVTISLVSSKQSYIVYLCSGSTYLKRTKCNCNYQALKCVDNYKKLWYSKYKHTTNLN